VPVLLMGGVPLSVTWTSTVFVEGPLRLDCHPGEDAIGRIQGEAGNGPSARVQVKVCGGRSMSVMTLV